MTENINPVLEKLGLSDTDRAVVFHADDIGMLNASNQAWSELAEGTPMTAASVMVPCSWFPAAAKAIVQNENADVGVHTVLTSEWEAYRWRPISTAGTETGLLDDDGFLFNATQPVQENADVEAATAEMKAQIERALAAGIDVTHIDSHMGAVFHPRLLEAYIRLGFAYQVPALIMRSTPEGLQQLGFSEQVANQVIGALQFVEAQGMPLFDSITMLPLREAQSVPERMKYAQNILENYGPGLHYFIFHPAVESLELKSTAPDWDARAGDYELFKSEEWAQIVEDSGVKLVSMRQVRGVLRAALNSNK
ncbi:MAG: polysaccharide deacetylase family protein [Chloroflexota bacterium]